MSLEIRAENVADQQWRDLSVGGQGFVTNGRGSIRILDLEKLARCEG
jgi:hypothetical protein